MKTMRKDITAEKVNGRFYTPEFIVNSFLDLSGYYGESILKKHAIDNSCGDGAFYVRWFIDTVRQQSGRDTVLKKQNRTYTKTAELSWGMMF